LPKPRNRRVQPAIKINDSTVGPKPADQFFAGYDLSGVLEQSREYLKRLLLESQPNAVLAQFSAANVHLESAESYSAHRGFG
jgi:hypothetical protein